MSESYAPLNNACVRGLCDKVYEKRKFVGAEIEKMVKEFNTANNTSQIKRLIKVLGQDLMPSTNPNVKNGALMGLSSVAVGLGMDSVNYLNELLQPILACFNEAESKVRYQAAEALFNVLKIVRGAALTHFAELFNALSKLSADPEQQVRQGAELLDRMLKDIVTESDSLEVGALVSLLRERMYARGPGPRQFVISWVGVLDAVPDLDLLALLPELLDPLLRMLDDPMPEIRRMCGVQLNEFLRSIKKQPDRVDFPAMINILIVHAQSTEEMLQLTSITWMKEWVELSNSAMLPYTSGILLAVLPCLAYTDDSRRNIRECAATVNMLLSRLVDSGSEGLDLEAVVEALVQLLHHNNLHTKQAALDWILHLYNRLPSQMSPLTEAVFGSVVGSLTDSENDVVRRALAVLAEICSSTLINNQHAQGDLQSSPYYHKFLNALLQLLAADENLLEDRGAFIIRQLCVLLNAEDVYGAIAGLVPQQQDLRFAATLVSVLSTILLTAAELHDLRTALKNMDKPSTRALFKSLYSCWCHSPVALLSLCLLTHNYDHCSRLIHAFADLEITVDFLTEVDKLVQLIESPIFAYLRLELLGSGGTALRSALYGLLMLLPQTDAFHTLRKRLQCVPEHLTSVSNTVTSPKTEIHDASLEEFKRVQAAHRAYKLSHAARSV